jgi:hypothetical protein
MSLGKGDLVREEKPEFRCYGEYGDGFSVSTDVAAHICGMSVRAYGEKAYDEQNNGNDALESFFHDSILLVGFSFCFQLFSE